MNFPVISPLRTTQVDLAEVVVEAEVFPRIRHCLRDVDETLGRERVGANGLARMGPVYIYIYMHR